MQEDDVRLLKRLAIIFDRAVFFPFGLPSMGKPNTTFGKQHFIQQWAGNEASVRRQLEQIILWDSDLISDVETFYRSFYYGQYSQEGELVTDENRESFISFVTNYVDTKYANKDARDRWNLYKMYAGYIESDHRLFRIVNRDFNNCSALLTDLHELAVLETLKTRTNSPNKISETVGNLYTRFSSFFRLTSQA
jgi:hypothetical protein